MVSSSSYPLSFPFPFLLHTFSHVLELDVLGVLDGIILNGG
jgi:hypothetical protein